MFEDWPQGIGSGFWAQGLGRRFSLGVYVLGLRGLQGFLDVCTCSELLSVRKAANLR